MNPIATCSAGAETPAMPSTTQMHDGMSVSARRADVLTLSLARRETVIDDTVTVRVSIHSIETGRVRK